MDFTKLIPIVGDLASSAFDFVLGQDSASKANENARENAAVAWNRQYSAWKTRYQYTMDDMLKAGLNPILAATGGFNVGNSPSIASAQTFQGQVPSTHFGSTALSFAQAKKAEEEALKVVTEIKYLKAQAEQSVEQAAKIRQETTNLTRQERVIIQEYWNKQAEFEKLTAEAYKAMSQHDLNVQQKNLVILKARDVLAALSKLEAISSVYKTPGGRNMVWIQEVLKTLTIPIQALLGAQFVKSRKSNTSSSSTDQ